MLTKLTMQMKNNLGLAAKQDVLDGFWTMIYTRHMIWYKRFVLNKPPPWTKNRIFLEYKFTNMYRELDRGTIYLLDNIANKGTPYEDVFNIILYRLFNRISTYDQIGFQTLLRAKSGAITWPAFGKSFEKIRRFGDAGNPIYTDAHMVCAYEHYPGKDKLERIWYIVDQVLDHLWEIMEAVYDNESLGPLHKFLITLPGIGPFIAYEVAVDISYCEWNSHHDDEWVNPGPGCQRGLKAIFPGIKPRQCQEAIELLRYYQRDEFDRLNLPFFDIAYKGKELTLRNIEHDLCEFFKYHKALLGLGRPRNKFVAVTQPNTKTHSRLKG